MNSIERRLERVNAAPTIPIYDLRALHNYSYALITVDDNENWGTYIEGDTSGFAEDFTSTTQDAFVILRIFGSDNGTDFTDIISARVFRWDSNTFDTDFTSGLVWHYDGNTTISVDIPNSVLGSTYTLDGNIPGSGSATGVGTGGTITLTNSGVTSLIGDGRTFDMRVNYDGNYVGIRVFKKGVAGSADQQRTDISPVYFYDPSFGELDLNFTAI